MKTRISIFLTFLTLAISSCKKDDNSNPFKGFKWNENSSSTEIIADSTWVNSAYNTIIAQKSVSTKIEINLAALAPSVYTVTSSTQNAVTFMIENTTHIANSGTVTISTNSDNKLTGSFDVTESGIVGNSSVKGVFTDIQIKP